MGCEHEGHRQRILAKLEIEDLPDHELLEALLFPLLPRRNTNDVAHRLIEKFGSIFAVYAASKEALQSVEGVGENVARNLRSVGRMMDKYFQRVNRVFTGEYRPLEFVNFVKSNYVDETTETVDIYLFDENWQMNVRKRYSGGERDSVFVDGAELSRLLSDGKTAAVVLVHNHPNGNERPSDLDDEATLNVQKICRINGVFLCDHIVYAGGKAYSYAVEARKTADGTPYILEGLLRVRSNKESVDEGDEEHRK